VEKAVFPQRTCREPVWGSEQAYWCEIVDLHPGPCASFSVKDSVERRDAWEAANPDWRKDIGSSDIII